MRQALAGMLWSKQYYYYDVDRWLGERGSDPFGRARAGVAQRALAPHVQRRRHLDARQVGVPVVRGVGPRVPRPRADAGRPGFGKAQLELMLRDRTCTRAASCRPTSGTSADVNPPVHAWSTIFTYRLEQARGGDGDVDGSSACSRNCSSTSPGGSTARTATAATCSRAASSGLDNIGVFDRSSPLPTGGYLEQADGTAWMALFCQNMIEIAIELAMAGRPTPRWPTSSSTHFLWIATSMMHAGRRTRACGTRRTASSTTCCACPTDPPSGSRCARWWACCRCAL